MSLDQQIRHLFNSAARAPRPLPSGAPFALERKVLAGWRALPVGGVDLGQVLLPLLRRAALCACALMFLSVAFSYRAIITPENEETTIANAAVDLSVLP